MVQAQVGPITPRDHSRALQLRLHLAAKRSRNRRFHALYDRIFRPDRLWRAWQEVHAITKDLQHGRQPVVAQVRRMDPLALGCRAGCGADAGAQGSTWFS